MPCPNNDRINVEPGWAVDAMGQSPGNQSPDPGRKWYTRASTWVAAAVLAGAAAFVSNGVTRLLTAGAERVGGGDPITVVTRTVSDCPFSYVVPEPPDAIPPPPSIETAPVGARERWSRRVGGLDGGSTQVEITVTGTKDQAVVLQGLDVEVIARKDPIDGVEVHAVCGDLVTIRYMIVDLDQRPPTITASVDDRSLSPDASEVVDEPVIFPYRVSRSEPEVFSVYAQARRCHCTWRARLRWVSGDRTGESVINDDGKPFVTHGTDGLTRYISNFGEPLARE